MENKQLLPLNNSQCPICESPTKKFYDIRVINKVTGVSSPIHFCSVQCKINFVRNDKRLEKERWW